MAIATIEVARPWQLVPYGVTTVLTDSLLTLGAAWVLMRVAQRDGIVWTVASILLAATIATSIFAQWLLNWAASALLQRGHLIGALLLHLVSRGWWLLVLIAVAHWLSPRSLIRTVIAAVLGYAVSAAMWWWLPAMPLLTTASNSVTTAIAQIDTDTDTQPVTKDDGDDEETDDSSSKPDFDAEQVMYDQSDLLDAAIERVKGPDFPTRRRRASRTFMSSHSPATAQKTCSATKPNMRRNSSASVSTPKGVCSFSRTMRQPSRHARSRR